MKFVILFILCFCFLLKENTKIITVKKENDHLENEVVFSDDSLVISDNERNLLEGSNNEISLSTSAQEGMLLSECNLHLFFFRGCCSN